MQILIETPAGVENADAIAALDGVDMLGDRCQRPDRGARASLASTTIPGSGSGRVGRRRRARVTTSC